MGTFFVQAGGKKYGPFDAAKLKALATHSKIGREDKISKDGETGWVAAGTVKGLFPEAELIVPKPAPPAFDESDRTVFDKAGAAAIDALPVVGKATATAAKKTGTAAVAVLAFAGRAVVSTARRAAVNEPAPPTAPPIAQPQPAPQIVYVQQAPPPQQIVINNMAGDGRHRKSALVAFLLAFFFGPLGMLYSTVFGALVMFVLTIVIAVPTLGLGVLFTWPIGCLWAASAASRS